MLGNVVDSVAVFTGVSGLVFVVINIYVPYFVRDLYYFNNQYLIPNLY
jgi:hypothetical protein